jgi:hypothetical protein
MNRPATGVSWFAGLPPATTTRGNPGCLPPGTAVENPGRQPATGGFGFAGGGR